MIKKIFTVALLTLLLPLSTLGILGNTTNAQTVSQQIIQNPQKNWTISFNNTVANTEQNLQTIYVQSTNNEKHAVSIQISADSKKVIVKPKIPYLFGTMYTLVIPSQFTSNDGKNIKAEVTKQFQIQGNIITDISALANPLFTNIIVKGSDEMIKVTADINGGSEFPLIRNNAQFSKGQQGLVKGDFLTIRAYDRHNNVVETQYYKVK